MAEAAALAEAAGAAGKAARTRKNFLCHEIFARIFRHNTVDFGGRQCYNILTNLSAVFVVWEMRNPLIFLSGAVRSPE